MYGITEILYDITFIHYDITILYPWCHIHSIHDSTPNLYGITYFILAISQRLYIWQDTCVYDIILSIYDILHGVRMETKPRYLTSHSQYMCNQTHLIDDIIHYVCMKSHPMHVGHQRHIYGITSSLDDITQVFVCHGTHYVYDIVSTIYNVTHTVCMTRQALYQTWNTFYLPSHPLYMSSHPLCRRHHTNCVRHHRWHMFAIMCSIHDTIFTL